MSAIVFVSQLPVRMEGGSWIPTIDISPATEHGELRYCVPSGMNYPSADVLVPQIKDALRPFSASRDYVLALGDPLVMAVTAALVARMSPKFRLLKWDRFQRRYIAYEVSL